ncbi:MAG: hypothetical protein ACD_41C00385G0009 [uncultured bacterium]|nr:MAG: hypothetical protein ACD_41C00385G0009 [uncultured bacterium]HBY73811.1 hypothetical protein [Candidatus Kerfeldbacteria bacterium]
MDLEKEVSLIQERNQRVEADKAWETSAFRVITITTMTYVVAVVVLYLMDIERFYLSALIPTVGFFLSVQSLPLIKRWWVATRWRH